MALYKYVAVLLLGNFIHTTTPKLMCQSTNNCMCAYIDSKYEFQCPMEEPKIVIKIQPHYMADIQCISMNRTNWNDGDLPIMDVGKVERCEFQQCPLPTNNFASLFRTLGINSTKALRFSFSDDFENRTLTADYFQDMADLERLILNNNNIGAIDEDAFEALDKLKEIDLKSNEVQLKADLFQNSSKLRLLDLAKNELSTLPKGLFRNLVDLRILHLFSNHLTALDGEIFSRLKNLNLLELSLNRLQDLAEDSFHGLENLKELSLSRNYLQIIPEQLFKRNTLLEKINFNFNTNLTLPGNLFQNLTNLKQILLVQCKLSDLPQNLFSGLKRLKTLDLKENEILDLPQDIFKDLMELETLDLSGNKIEALPDGAFASLEELKTLHLQYNKIASLQDDCFNGLEQAEEINLSNNRIQFIHVKAFISPSNLRKIILANNGFDLPESDMTIPVFSSNVFLEEIILSNNKIRTISDDFILSKVNLKKLDLRNNLISYVTYRDLMTVSNSATIYLMNNNITTVDFHLAELLARSQGNQDAYSSNAPNRKIFLDSNPIECDCNMFDLARYFERTIDPMVPTLVAVNADELTCASPPDFRGLRVKDIRQKWLACSFEQLGLMSGCPENCSCMFRPWDKSLVVNCIGANLTEVPELVLPVEDIYNQTEVHLQQNLLTSGPKADMGYENVTRLYLSSNKINDITWIPPRIKVLELHNNNISSLSYNTLLALNASSFTNITLGNNPWNCDCTNANLTTFLVSHLATKHMDTNNIKCRNGGKLLVRLSINDLCPNHTALFLGLGLSLALIILLIAIPMAVYYRFEQEIKVWLFAHSMCLWFVTEEEIDKDKQYDAFICFSHKDEDFVVGNLLPVLEQGPQPYKLCVHTRDWITGEFIAKQIVKSVEDSRRTLVILSSNFLESEWGIMEFRTAYKQGMNEKRPRVIVIVYGDVDVDGETHPDLKAYIKTNTYVKWGDPNFWDKLRYALPHSPGGSRSVKSRNMMISLNDKLNLINGAPMTPNPGSTPPATAINLDPLLLKNNPLDFARGDTLTPPAAESGLKPLIITMNQ